VPTLALGAFYPLEPIHIFLIAAAMAVAIGGVFMLFRGANSQDTGSDIDTPRPLIPLGTIAVGLIIAYHTYSDYRTLESMDVAIMFVFIAARAVLMGLRFFIVDKSQPSGDKQRIDGPVRTEPGEEQRD
jgi:hypothetical protein